jgi:hypothetical protein
MVRDALPGSRVSFADGAGPDLRNCRADFFKLAGTFPDCARGSLMAGTPAQPCYRPDNFAVARWPTR